ncbi:MAG: DUF4080 domain-containing protein [Thermodesulfobacteriota bacterium]
MNIHLIGFNCRFSHSCPALFYVRNELERHLPGTTPTLHQFTINDPYFETLLTITGFRADALLFSVYIWNASYLQRLLPDIHRVLPETPIVLGGPQAPALRELLPFRATVVHNEIEGVDAAFFGDLASGELREDYRSTPGGHFPSPYRPEDFQTHLRDRNIYYESSRGCPFFCSYCLSSLSRGVTAKDLAQVREELLAIFPHQPREIRFVDRTFNAEPRRALAIWAFLLENAPAACSFHFEIAPDLFTEEMFVFLEEVEGGRFRFEIGIQSTHRRTLAAVNRKMDVDRALAAIRRLRQHTGVHLHVDLILGLPFEDETRFGQSLRDVLTALPQQLQMGLLKILPDTAIARQTATHGILSCREAPYQVLATRWLDHPTLARLYRLGQCLEAFYNKGFFRTFFSFLIPVEPDIFAWFRQLADRCAARNFFALAHTQALLHEILSAFVQEHDQAPLLLELLAYDWLLSGHRHLPGVPETELTAARDFLWRHAPTSLDGRYSGRDRNLFFKRGVFRKFSAPLLALAGLGTGGEGYLGFLSDRKNARAVAIAIPVAGPERGEDAGAAASGDGPA